MSKSISFGNNVIEQMPSSGPVRLWDCGVEWARLQPTPTTWDWKKLDQLVAQAENRSIMLVLGHPPEWAAEGGSDGKQAAWLLPGSNRPPASIRAWIEYVSTVVTRYRNTINCYQIWNEPADKRFYSGDLETLALYAKVAYTTIKGISPTAKVVSPPLQPRRQAHWNTKGKTLIKALNKYGNPFDVWGGHIYPQIGEGTVAWVRDAKMMLAVTQETQKPLWITESNFNVGGPNNPYIITKQKQLLDTIRLRCYALDIPRVYWYGYGHSQPELFGIVQT